MWKLIRSTFKATIGRIAASETPPKPVASGLTAYLSKSDKSKLESQLVFRNVLKELGAAEFSRNENSSINASSKLKSLSAVNSDVDLHTLSGDQLDELAQSYCNSNDGYEQNYSKAYEIWSIGANKGHIASLYSQAICLLEGKGTKKNMSNAYHILQELADKENYVLAHYAVGIMHSLGQGTIINDELAFKHFMSAAKQGVVPACYNVAQCYAAGKGVLQSDSEARKFFEAGALVGDIQSKFTLSVWLNLGRGGEVDKVRAFSICNELASAGHNGSMFNLGVYYMSGQGVHIDYDKAVIWFQQAANRGVVHAALNLSKMYLEGVGVDKDLRKAEETLRPFILLNEDCKEMHADVVRNLLNKK